MVEHKTYKPPNKSRNFRLSARLDVKDVAFLMNIKNCGRISEWEDGKASPSIENLIKLSIIYKTLSDQLYYELRKKLVKEIEQRQRLLAKKKEVQR